MEAHKIQAEARGDHGKGLARKLRAAGRVPAVAYGGGGSATTLALDPDQLRILRKSPLGWNQPVTIEVDGGDDIELAMLREVQKHPLSGNVLHCDFLTVAADQPVIVEVPFALEGKAKGQELGGKLRQPLRTMKLSCLPKDIPSSIVIDITELDVGDKIMLSAVELPTGVEGAWRHDAAVVNLIRGRVKK
jgi:large subunit ribosomal protein L25